jgi:hypothetical protein
MSQVRAYGNTYEPAKYDKVLLDGSADDAREYVENNFPRHHGTIPTPDVYVEHDDGRQEHFYGGEWLNLGEDRTDAQASLYTDTGVEE